MTQTPATTTQRKAAPIDIPCGIEAANIVGAQVLAGVMCDLERLESLRHEVADEWDDADNWIDYALDLVKLDVLDLRGLIPEHDDFVGRLYCLGNLVTNLWEQYTGGESNAYGRTLRSLGLNISAQGELVETVVWYGRFFEVTQ